MPMVRWYTKPSQGSLMGSPPVNGFSWYILCFGQDWTPADTLNVLLAKLLREVKVDCSEQLRCSILLIFHEPQSKRSDYNVLCDHKKQCTKNLVLDLMYSTVNALCSNTPMFRLTLMIYMLGLGLGLGLEL